MGDIVDIQQYLSSMPNDNELETAMMKSLDALPIKLSDAEKQEVYLYAKKLWNDVKHMEQDSLYSFTLEIPCTNEQRERVAEQITECVNCLINPRAQMINNLVAELIVSKIREVKSRS